MAVRRAQITRPDLREILIREHAGTVLKWAVQLGADDQIARSTAWIAAVRAGKPLRISWWELPEGTLPRGGHNPNDEVDIGPDDTITWSG